MVRLLTVGHGTLAADEFASLVTTAGIEVIVDVRSFPASRRHPQFGRDAMQRWLEDAGIGYRWEPRLGGRRRPRPDSPHQALRVPAFRGYADHMESPEFDAALGDVLAAAERERTAVMCAESVWWRCHRRLLSDAAVLLHGTDVEHLFHDGRLTPHPPTPEARVDGDRIVYDRGEQALPLRDSR
jgi:uncharacterized protein (DUF488 family)